MASIILMIFISSSSVILSAIFLQEISAIKPPCGLRNAGIYCVNDEDCDGPHSLCLKSVCSCPTLFEQYTLDAKTQVCRPAPSKVGDKCESACRPPLVCQNKQCVCWKADVVGGQCVLKCPAGQTLVNQECRPASGLGGKCERDSDCVTPFTYCKSGGVCDCVPGAVRSGQSCSAACPDGSKPGQICRKKYINDPNIYYNGESMDTCPKASYCVTYGKPEVGQCCPLACPYGSPDTSKSCKAGVPAASRCPELSTHYCQEFETKGGVNRLCCPRPCREPTPLYLDGACLPLAHWGDPCTKSEQCEAGVTMACNAQSGRCECKPNCVQRNGTFPTCELGCGAGEVAVAGKCYKTAAVNQPCVHNNQCPGNAHCREGLCECNCKYVISNGGCQNPDDPLNVGGILDKFQQLFRGSGSNSG